MSRTKKRKAFRSKQGPAKKARQEVQQISKDVLGQFWDLPRLGPDVKKKAAVSLDEAMSSVGFIQPHGEQAGNVDDSVLESLIKGATSSQDGSYQASALALATICSQAKTETVTERAMNILCDTWTTVSVKSRVQTRGRREGRLGFLYCCAALVRGPHTLSTQTARDVLKMLREIAREQESWHLGTPVVKFVAEILQKLEKSGQLEKVLDVVDRWLRDRSGREDGKLLHQLCLLRHIPVPASLGTNVQRKALMDCLEPECIRSETESSLPWLWELAFRNAAARSSESLRFFWTSYVMPVFEDEFAIEKIAAMYWLIPLLIELAPSQDDIFAILSRNVVRKMNKRRASIKSRDRRALGGKILLQFEQRSSKLDLETRFALATFLCNLSLSTILFAKVLKLTAFPRLFGSLNQAAPLQVFVKLMHPVVDHVNASPGNLTLNSDKALRILVTLIADIHCPILDEVMHYVFFRHGCSTLDNPELVSLLPDTRKAKPAELRQLNRLVYAMFLRRTVEQRRAVVLRLAEVAGNSREERIQKTPVDLLRDKAIQLCLSLQENKSGSSSASILICAVIILEGGAEKIVRSVGAKFLEIVEKEHVSSGELLQSLESRHAIVECIVRLLQVNQNRIQSLLYTAFGEIGHFVTEGLLEPVFERILEGVEIGEDVSEAEEHEESLHGDEEERKDDREDSDGDSDQEEEEVPAAERQDTDESDGSEHDVDVKIHVETDPKVLLNRRGSSGRTNAETPAANTVKSEDESDGSEFVVDVLPNDENEGRILPQRRRSSDRVPPANLEETSDPDVSEFYVDVHGNTEKEGHGTVLKHRPSLSGKSTIHFPRMSTQYRLRLLEMLAVLSNRDCLVWREVVFPSRLIELASKCAVRKVVRRALLIAKRFMNSTSAKSSRTRQTVVLELERISKVVCSKWHDEVSPASQECLLKLCKHVASLPDTESEGIERMNELVSEMLWSFERSTKQIGLSGDTLVELIRRQPRIGLALVEDLSEIVRSGHSQDTRSVAIQALTIIMNDSDTRESEKSAQIETVFHNAVRQAELTEPKPLKTLILLGIEGATHGWNQQALSTSASALEHATKNRRELEKLRKRLYELSWNYHECKQCSKV